MSEKIDPDRNDEDRAAAPEIPGEPAPESRPAEPEVHPKEGPAEEGPSEDPAADADRPENALEEMDPAEDVSPEAAASEYASATSDESEEKASSPDDAAAPELVAKPSDPAEAEPSKDADAKTVPQKTSETADAAMNGADTLPAEAPAKKRGLARKILLALLVLILLAVAAVGVLYTQGKKKIFEEPVAIREGAGVEVVKDGATGRAVDIRVRPGDTMRSAVLRLKEAGFELDENLMRFAFRLHPKTTAPMHSGVFRFPEGTTHAGVIDILTGPPLLDRSVRIPDGAPVWEVRKAFGAAEELEGKTSALDAAAFAKAVGLPEGMSPEGWFAPDTYRYSSGTDDLALWRQAYRCQKETLEAAWATRPADSVLKTPYEALILASIIEKETSVDADRTKVSSVFHNRLKRGMPLQTDPTVIYGIGPEFNGNLTRADLRRPTPYNTYTMNTLPPTPIAMPSKASIEAAVHPADTKYLYFVARGDGTSEFSRTLAEHNRAVRRFILNKNQRIKNKDSK